MSKINAPLCLRLLENTPSFVIMIDQKQSVYWLNQSFCDFLGVEREDVIGRSAENTKEPCLKQVLNAKVRVDVFGGILDKCIELQDVMMLNGDDFDMDTQELTVCFYADASKKVQTEKQLLQLESTLAQKMPHDSITGMLNHYSMYHTLSSEVSRSRRYNNPLSLVLMDIDFQSCANISSEEKIEQIRLMISQLLKDQMRWADIIGHLDEHDFALLLPETGYHSAETLVDKLNKNMQHISMDTKHISYGISQWEKGDDVNMFVNRAAEKLHTLTSH